MKDEDFTETISADSMIEREFYYEGRTLTLRTYANSFCISKYGELIGRYTLEDVETFNRFGKDFSIPLGGKREDMREIMYYVYKDMITIKNKTSRGGWITS